MSFIGEKNFGLEVALGNVPGYSRLFVFGVAPDCDVDDPTDIWDGADGVTSTKIWVPPTTARIHDLVSNDAADTAAGAGLRTLRVLGLTDWTLDQVTEVITLDGTTPVSTVNSYVMINRLVGITFGTVDANVGIITATAQTDATITAAIQPARGESLMAIRGLPGTKNLCITAVSSSLGSAKSGTYIAIFGRVRLNPQLADSGFILTAAQSTSQAHQVILEPPGFLPGPVLMKLQAEADTNNTAIAGSFSAYVVDKNA